MMMLQTPVVMILNDLLLHNGWFDALPENQRSYSQAEGISTATSPQVLLSAARSSPVVQ